MNDRTRSRLQLNPVRARSCRDDHRTAAARCGGWRCHRLAAICVFFHSHRLNTVAGWRIIIDNSYVDAMTNKQTGKQASSQAVRQTPSGSMSTVSCSIVPSTPSKTTEHRSSVRLRTIPIDKSWDDGWGATLEPAQNFAAAARTESNFDDFGNYMTITNDN